MLVDYKCKCGCVNHTDMPDPDPERSRCGQCRHPLFEAERSVESQMPLFADFDEPTQTPTSTQTPDKPKITVDKKQAALKQIEKIVTEGAKELAHG